MAFVIPAKAGIHYLARRFTPGRPQEDCLFFFQISNLKFLLSSYKPFHNCHSREGPALSAFILSYVEGVEWVAISYLAPEFIRGFIFSAPHNTNMSIVNRKL